MTGRVSFIPPHLPFLKTLAQHLLTENTPIALAQHSVLLPTQRACLKLAEILTHHSPTHSTLLPTLIPLGGMDMDDIALSSLDSCEFMKDLPPLITEEERLGLLTGMVQDFYQKEQKPLKTSQAASLAATLITFINQVQTEGLSFQELKNLVPDDYAAHWQITLHFLDMIGDAWPKLLVQKGKIERATVQRLLLERRNADWEQNPPAYPVIAAGSTGSIPATAALLKTISRLPKGQVILPGLDPAVQVNVVSSHPQHTMQHLLKILEIDPVDVEPFVPPCITPHPRTHIMGEMFQETPKTLTKEEVEKGIATIRLTQCAHPQEESAVIALAIREALEDITKTIAFITPDRDLAKRVINDLKRWKIRANDSAGTPFSQTPLGIFCLLTSEWFQETVPPVTLLATLKHPHAKTFKNLGQTLEKDFLRKGTPFHRIVLDDDQFMFIKTVINDAKLFALKENVSFQELWDYHKHILKILSQDPLLMFNDNEETQAFQIFLEHMDTPSFLLQKGNDYSTCFRHFISLVTVRQKYALHPRLTILGLIEARLIPADFMILGGLNENAWPPKPSSDPWFNQAMRKKFGLPDHERRVGLSSLDFIHAASCEQVLLTRSMRSGGSPTVPSRLLSRFQSYLKQNNLSLKIDDTLLTLSQDLHKPKERLLLSPPSPCPPLDTRPKSLSITDVTTLMHDPYSVYAKHILKLKPLKPLDYQAGPLEFGIFVHEILEHLMKGPVTKENGMALGQQFFQRYFENCSEQFLWWCRFERILDWFIQTTKDMGLPLRHFEEVKGTWSFDTFTLIGKADRIEENPEGWTIIDYKTGSIPTQKEMEKGLAPQLALEALILRHGGFDKITPTTIHALSFWKLQGDMEGGTITQYTKDLIGLLDVTDEGLRDLIETFNDPSTPYLSIPYEAGLYDDYHHLARIKEWRLNP